jgi:hypothetical protein
MTAMTHHMPLAGDFTMTDPHREDWLRVQGQTSGKQHPLMWEPYSQAKTSAISGQPPHDQL